MLFCSLISCLFWFDYDFDYLLYFDYLFYLFLIQKSWSDFSTLPDLFSFLIILHVVCMLIIILISTYSFVVLCHVYLDLILILIFFFLIIFLFFLIWKSWSDFRPLPVLFSFMIIVHVVFMLIGFGFNLLRCSLMSILILISFDKLM